MNRLTMMAAMIPLAALMSGCDDGSDGNDGADGLNSLVATRALPLGDADCPGGGLAFDSGLDSNANGVLDASEVTATEFLECEAAPLLRAFHASPDAPAVNILVNGAAALTDVPFKAASGFLPAAESTQLQVEAIIPGGNAIVIDETLPLTFNTEYTVVALGTVNAPISAIVIENPAGEPIFPGNVRAQVLHAAEGAPAVDVFVTAAGADLTASAPVNTTPLAFQGFTDRVEVPAGNYQIRVTLAGDPATVVYDTGEIPLPGDVDLLIAAVDNTRPGDRPIELVLIDSEGASDLDDAAKPSAAIAVHASPDAGNVDILADDGATAEDDALALAVNVPFTAACIVESVPVGSFTLNVTPTGDPATIALPIPYESVAGAATTAIVTGFLMSTPELQPIAFATDARSVITETRLRVTHASPSTGDVDIYLLADGTDFTDDSVEPSFAAVPFTADTTQLSIAPGVYDIYVTPAGDKDTVAIEVQDLAVNGGQVLDVIARDPATDGSEGALPQLIVIDYDTLGACAM
ncbi:MAG: DUF4397 domain-containing protein [Pseudomonadota bacterium]